MSRVAGLRSVACVGNRAALRRRDRGRTAVRDLAILGLLRAGPLRSALARRRTSAHSAIVGISSGFLASITPPAARSCSRSSSSTTATVAVAAYSRERKETASRLADAALIGREVEVPRAWHALELSRSGVCELKPGSDNEIPHGA
jgi:hypothetical protein